MNIEDYVAQYGEGPSLWRGGDTLLGGAQVIAAGMLKFDEDTAGSWGGPFPGNFAHYVVIDYRLAKYRGEPYCEALDRTLEHELKELRKQIALPKKERHSRWHHCSTEQLEAYLDDFPLEYACSKKPIRIWMMGNDDTSYSKFFATVEAALEEVALMEGCQPLNMQDIYGNDYIFTN